MGFDLRFSDKEITAWGGMAIMKRMLDHLGFDAALTTAELPQPRSNRGYRPEQLMTQFMLSIWCGANRFEHDRQYGSELYGAGTRRCGRAGLGLGFGGLGTKNGRVTNHTSKYHCLYHHSHLEMAVRLDLSARQPTGLHRLGMGHPLHCNWFCRSSLVLNYSHGIGWRTLPDANGGFCVYDAMAGWNDAR